MIRAYRDPIYREVNHCCVWRHNYYFLTALAFRSKILSKEVKDQESKADKKVRNQEEAWRRAQGIQNQRRKKCLT